MCKHLKQATKQFRCGKSGISFLFVETSHSHLFGDESVDAVCVHAGDAIVSVMPDMYWVAAASHTGLSCSDAVLRVQS